MSVEIDLGMGGSASGRCAWTSLGAHGTDALEKGCHAGGPGDMRRRQCPLVQVCEDLGSLLARWIEKLRSKTHAQ